ncbi:MAG: MFS transporter [Acidimicrobiaceae bacterium]|nr:MFS transporter [Acidimicrobiaceae bacterium]
MGKSATRDWGNSDTNRGLKEMFSAFEVVPFRWVWSAALSGNSGRFAVILVAGWEAYRLGHHSSFWPSMVSLLLLIPSMFFGLFAGSAADRRNRARMAAGGQLINAISCALAAIFAATGKLDLFYLLVFTAAIGIGNSIQGPAWQAMIPDLVGRDRLLNASMTARIAQQGAELTGPAIATVVLTGWGPSQAFLLCTVFYLSGVAMLWHVRHAAITPKRHTERPHVLGQVAEGFSYIRKQAPLATMLVWVGLHCSLTMASVGILPAVATANLNGNAGAYGLLLTAFGLGSVVGPLFMMALGRRLPAVPILIISGFLSGLPLISLGLVHSLGVDLISAAMAGGAQAVFMAGIYSANQGTSTDLMRGRVASVQLSLTTGTMGIAGIGWGALVALISPGIVLALPGAIFVCACVPFALRRHEITRALASGADDPVGGV